MRTREGEVGQLPFTLAHLFTLSLLTQFLFWHSYLFPQRVVILFSLFYWAIVCLYLEIGVYFSIEGLYSV